MNYERKLCHNCRTITTCLELGCGQCLATPPSPSTAPDVSVTNYGNPVDKSMPEVKIERGRVWIVRGNQSFMLAYEPDADEPEATEWYANQLRSVLYGFTPCVNSAAQGADSPQAAQGVKDHEIRELVNTLRDIAVQYHDTQQLRARIHNVLLPAFKRAQLARQSQGEPVAAMTDKGRFVKWNPLYAQEPWVSSGYRPLVFADAAPPLSSEQQADTAPIGRAEVFRPHVGMIATDDDAGPYLKIRFRTMHEADAAFDWISASLSNSAPAQQPEKGESDAG